MIYLLWPFGKARESRRPRSHQARAICFANSSFSKLGNDDEPWNWNWGRREMGGTTRSRRINIHTFVRENGKVQENKTKGELKSRESSSFFFCFSFFFFSRRFSPLPGKLRSQTVSHCPSNREQRTNVHILRTRYASNPSPRPRISVHAVCVSCTYPPGHPLLKIRNRKRFRSRMSDTSFNTSVCNRESNKKKKKGKRGRKRKN